MPRNVMVFDQTGTDRFQLSSARAYLVYLNGMLLNERTDYAIDSYSLVLQITVPVRAEDHIRIVMSASDDGWAPTIGDFVWFFSLYNQRRPAKIIGMPTEFSSHDWTIDFQDETGGESYVKTDYLRPMSHLEALALQGK